MLLIDLVTATDAVAATSSRLAKVAALAAVLREMGPDEIAPAIGYLVASPRQGRLGVGWRSLTNLDVRHAAAPSLQIHDVDAALNRLSSADGPGSVAARRGELVDLAGRATAEEWDFLTRVMLGELRTGALEGVLLDAIAKAADRDAATVRRAAMPTMHAARRESRRFATGSSSSIPFQTQRGTEHERGKNGRVS